MLRSTALGLALLLFAGWPACAQTIYPPINTPVFRALDANGKPLSGGKLYTYIAGSSTPQSTYADPGGTSPNTNPVILDSTGSAKIFLAPQNYKFVLQDSNGVQQWTVDNITGDPPRSDVTSVFGRTGAVVAVTGDYTCSQITGAVCSIPTIYYQTIRNGGTDLAQRAKLNLIAGTNTGVTCADNSGGNSTDCTFTNSSSLPSPAQTDVTGSRSFGSPYQATTDNLIVSGQGSIHSGSGDSKITCYSDASPSPSTVVWAATTTSTISGMPVPIGSFPVIKNNYYRCDVTNLINSAPDKWVETTFH
jgi:hypothetical protein